MMLNIQKQRQQHFLRFYSAGVSLEGISHSGGFFKGKACVIPSLKQAKKFIPGSVLVIKSADNRWNDLIAECGALVQEKGDATSHGVWACWKQAIPVVSGIKDLFSYIEDNDEVVVRGSLGKVEVYRTEKSASSPTKRGRKPAEAKTKKLDDSAANEAVADKTTTATKTPRSKSAYQFYCAEHRKKLKEANPKANAAELMKMLADAWKTTPAEERAKYNDMAELDKDAKKKLNEQVLTS